MENNRSLNSQKTFAILKKQFCNDYKEKIDDEKVTSLISSLINNDDVTINYVTLRDLEKTFDAFSLNENQVKLVFDLLEKNGVFIDTDVTTDYQSDYTKTEKNALKAYITSSKTEVLSEEEEIELAKKKDAGDEDARNELINHNLRLVVNIASKYKGNNLSIDDLISAGNLGLIDAANKFDYRKARFTTYATYWIKARIIEAINEENQKVKLPCKYSDNLSIIKKTITELTSKLSRDPTDEEVYNNLPSVKNLTLDDVTAIRNLNARTISLDEKIGTDNETTRGEIIEDKNNDNPYDYTTKQMNSERLEKALASLEDREREIIEYRYGLKDGKILTFKEISEFMDISPERIRQLEQRALNKLKDIVEDKSVDESKS